MTDTASASDPLRSHRFLRGSCRRSLASLVTISTVAVVATIATITAPRDARASVLDLSASGGAVQRSLSTTDYKLSFLVQAQAELGIIPSILYLGPYFNFSQLVPKLATKDGISPSGSKFYGYGLRARVVIPTPGPLAPYLLVGAGGVHTDFPDQTVMLCSPQIGPVASQCTSKKLPSATANFAELTLGVGVRIDVSDDFRFFVEGAWKPTFGYQNDTWEKTAHQTETTGSTTPPDPSRNGYAFVGSAGMMVSF